MNYGEWYFVRKDIEAIEHLRDRKIIPKFVANWFLKRLKAKQDK